MTPSPLTATIFVDRLRIRALAGVDPQERVVGNDLEISVSIGWPGAVSAGSADDIGLTVSYADITDVIRHAAATPVMLLERIAWLVAAGLRERWPAITEGSVTVKKLAPPVEGAECQGMGVTFRWSR